MQSIHQKILSTIYGHGKGWCSSQIDSADLASRSAVNSALKRLAYAGTIRPVLRGLQKTRNGPFDPLALTLWQSM